MKTIKTQRPYNWLQLIRVRLGLSQEQMAEQLNMTRSMLSLAELGKRQLPTHVFLQVVQLETRLNENPPAAVYHQPHPVEKPSRQAYKKMEFELFVHAADCQRRIDGLETQLKKMNSTYNETRKNLEIIEAHTTETGSNTELAGMWERQEQLTLRTLERCNFYSQQLVQNRISLLRSELQLYNSMREELENKPAGFFKEEPG